MDHQVWLFDLAKVAGIDINFIGIAGGVCSGEVFSGEKKPRRISPRRGLLSLSFLVIGYYFVILCLYESPLRCGTHDHHDQHR
jgi:hypothetical protein